MDVIFLLFYVFPKIKLINYYKLIITLIFLIIFLFILIKLF